MRFESRLVLVTSTVVGLTVAVLIWGSTYSLRKRLIADFDASLTREAGLVAAALPDDSTTWPTVLIRLASETGHHVVVRGAGGVTIAEAGIAPATNVFGVSLPTRQGEVEVSGSLNAIDAVMRDARGAIGRTLLAAMAIALGLTWLAGRSISRPLVGLSQAAEAIAAGSEPHFPRSGVPEVDTLARALRRMHGELGARFIELERRKAESAAIVDAMVEGIIVADKRGKILTANPAARRLLGYGTDAVLPDLPALFRTRPAQDIVESVRAGEAVIDREVVLDDLVLSVNARSLGSSGVVLILHDLTGIRRLETMRRDFVANVSHELKTPLTSISGYAETLTDPATDPASRERFVATIMANARRMQRLVDDLLDLSRIESGAWTPTIQQVDIAGAGTDVWAMFREQAQLRGVELQVDVANDAKVASVDGDALRQILTNLFANAVRHVNPRGHIILEAVRDAGGVRITVVDDGPGIPAEHLPRIFERFYRADPSRARAEGGTGLGLAIVRHLVEAHGGRVDASSTVGTGTRLVLWFPDQVSARMEDK